jgi:hypothetical protein
MKEEEGRDYSNLNSEFTSWFFSACPPSAFAVSVHIHWYIFPCHLSSCQWMVDGWSTPMHVCFQCGKARLFVHTVSSVVFLWVVKSREVWWPEPNVSGHLYLCPITRVLTECAVVVIIVMNKNDDSGVSVEIALISWGSVKNKFIRRISSYLKKPRRLCL